MRSGARTTWSRPIGLSRPLAASSPFVPLPVGSGDDRGRLVHRQLQQCGVGEGPRPVRENQPAHTPAVRPGYGSTTQAPGPTACVPVPTQRSDVPGGTKKPRRGPGARPREVAPKSARTGPGRSVSRVSTSSVGPAIPPGRTSTSQSRPVGKRATPLGSPSQRLRQSSGSGAADTSQSTAAPAPWPPVPVISHSLPFRAPRRVRGPCVHPGRAGTVRTMTRVRETGGENPPRWSRPTVTRHGRRPGAPWRAAAGRTRRGVSCRNRVRGGPSPSATGCAGRRGRPPGPGTTW